MTDQLRPLLEDIAARPEAFDFFHALRRIEAQGDEAIDEAAWAAGRAVLDKDYEAVLDRGLANYKPTIPADASEDEILAEAVRITRRR